MPPVKPQGKTKLERIKEELVDASHEEQVDVLIPLAMARAKTRLESTKVHSERRPGKYGEPYRHCMLTQFFHEEMDIITHKLGLRCGRRR